MSRHALDARRLLCPLPVIRTQDRVAQLRPGDVLVVTCTDPGAKQDIPAWCRLNGHRIVDITDTDQHQILITIEVA